MLFPDSIYFFLRQYLMPFGFYVAFNCMKTSKIKQIRYHSGVINCVPFQWLFETQGVDTLFSKIWNQIFNIHSINYFRSHVEFFYQYYLLQIQQFPIFKFKFFFFFFFQLISTSQKSFRLLSRGSPTQVILTIFISSSLMLI